MRRQEGRGLLEEAGRQVFALGSSKAEVCLRRQEDRGLLEKAGRQGWVSLRKYLQYREQ